jgi:hypothetical protein
MLVYEITLMYFVSEIQILGSYIFIKIFLKKKRKKEISIRTEHCVSRVQEDSNRCGYIKRPS